MASHMLTFFYEEDSVGRRAEGSPCLIVSNTWKSQKNGNKLLSDSSMVIQIRVKLQHSNTRKKVSGMYKGMKTIHGGCLKTAGKLHR